MKKRRERERERKRKKKKFFFSKIEAPSKRYIIKKYIENNFVNKKAI
jgi:hypothetical protein